MNNIWMHCVCILSIVNLYITFLTRFLQAMMKFVRLKYNALEKRIIKLKNQTKWKLKRLFKNIEMEEPTNKIKIINKMLCSGWA